MSLRIWSLEEIMRHYNVWQLVHAIECLQDMQCQGNLAAALPREDNIPAEDVRVPDQHMNGIYVPWLKYVQTQCEYLELPAALARIPHFNREIRQGITWAELRNQAQVLHEAIHADLCYRRFAYVSMARASLHDRFGNDWAAIWEKFPDAKEDSLRAIDCYALEQDTACVFHLMRVAEVGLRAIAKKVRVSLKDKGRMMPIEYATWDKVINGIKSKITAAHQSPKSHSRNEKLQFYSDATDQCMFIRDIWRNDVAHARKHYNGGEALGSMTRVRQFMELLVNSL